MAWRLNLRQMEAFRAIMLTGSTTGAADALNLTQPAVSRLLKDLESQLGVDLFVRRRGRLHATSEAEWLFRESEEPLSRLKRLDVEMRDIRHVQRGEIRLVATVPMAYGVLPDALTGFRMAHPEISVSVQITVRREVPNWTGAQNFDLAITTLPIEYPAEHRQHLVKAPGVCVLPIGHPLSNAEVVSAKDLENENLISLLPETLYRIRLDRMFERLGIARRLTIETQTASSICAYVAAGLGVAIVDPFTARRFIPLGICVRPFEPLFEYEYNLLYPIRPTQARAVRAIVPFIAESVSKSMTWYNNMFPEHFSDVGSPTPNKL